MSIRNVFIASLLGVFAYTSMAYANSCSNVDVIGTFDQSGLQEHAYGLNAFGTFRIAGEGDEAKQPMFNFARVDCENQTDDTGRASLECKLVQAVVWSQAGKPDADKPNCSLDLNSSTYSMKELQRGVLTGIDTSYSMCYDAMLTIDRNTKRVYLSFTKTKFADNNRSNACGATLPRTEVLMNCTAWPKLRKKGETPQRYCDFSSAGDKH
jgi:hypothetical protein